jgi:uncharacterized protein (UPF0335 family)
MAAETTDIFENLSEQELKKIQTTYNAIQTLDEEKKTISQEISDEKKGCANEIGIKVKELNNLFKVLKMRENGINTKRYDQVIDRMEGV